MIDDPKRKDMKKHRNDRFPYTTYLCSGSQASKKNENKLYVMKWSQMHRVVKEDPDASDSEDEVEGDKEMDPVMRFE